MMHMMNAFKPIEHVPTQDNSELLDIIINYADDSFVHSLELVECSNNDYVECIEEYQQKEEKISYDFF